MYHFHFFCSIKIHKSSSFTTSTTFVLTVSFATLETLEVEAAFPPLPEDEAVSTCAATTVVYDDLNTIPKRTGIFTNCFSFLNITASTWNSQMSGCCHLILIKFCFKETNTTTSAITTNFSL